MKKRSTLDPIQVWLLEQIVALQAQAFLSAPGRPASPDEAVRAATQWLMHRPAPPAVKTALAGVLADTRAARQSIPPPRMHDPAGRSSWLPDDDVTMIPSQRPGAITFAVQPHPGAPLLPLDADATPPG
jgi:hypothetical protein